jgi:DNA polymerase III subunit epsilon
MRLRRPARSPAARAYDEAAIPPAETPWREAGYAVVDLETTGLDPDQDEIVSFAAVPIDAGRITVGAVSTLTIRPSRMPGAETIRIHGLRPQDLAEAQELPAVLDSILEALTSRVLVAHAAWVERGFLSEAIEEAGVRLRPPVIDTVALFRRAQGQSAVGEEAVVPLSDAARDLGLPVHRPHHADGDALTTAQVFLALATRLDAREAQTVGSLARSRVD